MEGKNRNTTFAVLTVVSFKFPSSLGHDAVYTCKYARIRLPVPSIEPQTDELVIQ